MVAGVLVFMGTVPKINDHRILYRGMMLFTNALLICNINSSALVAGRWQRYGRIENGRCCRLCLHIGAGVGEVVAHIIGLTIIRDGGIEVIRAVSEIDIHIVVNDVVRRFVGQP